MDCKQTSSCFILKWWDAQSLMSSRAADPYFTLRTVKSSIMIHLSRDLSIKKPWWEIYIVGWKLVDQKLPEKREERDCSDSSARQIVMVL